MSPFKLSLVNPGNDDPDETVELDDELVGQLKQAVDADPDLTLAEALRQGVQHVAENGPMRRGQTESDRRSVSAGWARAAPAGPHRPARAAVRGCPGGCPVPG